METLRSLLPSINGLVVFEAAGRLGSFTAAARELRMTQAAVSYAVNRLEEHLGTPLFLRALHDDEWQVRCNLRTQIRLCSL